MCAADVAWVSKGLGLPAAAAAQQLSSPPATTSSAVMGAVWGQQCVCEQSVSLSCGLSCAAMHVGVQLQLPVVLGHSLHGVVGVVMDVCERGRPVCWC